MLEVIYSKKAINDIEFWKTKNQKIYKIFSERKFNLGNRYYVS